MKNSKVFKATVAVIITAAVIAGLIWMIWPHWIHGMWGVFRATWVIFVPAVILATFGVMALNRKSRYVETTPASWGLWGIALIWLIVSPFAVNYMQKAELSKSVIVAEDSPNDLSFRERAPFEVAAATSDRTLGNTTGDATGYVRALPAVGENGFYSTSVIRRGFLQGYESIQMLDIPLFGTADANNVSFCDFSEKANLRMGGGLPQNSLVTAILHRSPLGTKANSSDAFMICEGEGDEVIPMVYAPLTRQVGFAITKRVPAGVAIYNGKTGELVIEDSYEGNYPIYPISLAEAQRASFTASDGFANWLFGRSGFEDTSKDSEDPNGSNRSEFSLANADGTTHYYVTPLNARGSSSSIVAVGNVEASKMNAGKLNDYVIRKYEDSSIRQANSAIADTITAGVLSGYQAQGLSVFEVVPSLDGNWTATIGKKQSILYRATVEPNGTVTLRDAKGKQVGAVVSSDGTIEEIEAPESDSNSPIQSDSISTMTEDELRELGNAVLEELANRANNG